MEQIKKWFIVGGIHGNEKTGVELIKAWQQDGSELIIEGVKNEYIFGNPKAIEKNVRYIDKDLNRCFSKSILSQNSTRFLEEKRAQELNHQIGPKGVHQSQAFLVDLHTTTSAMGACIILSKRNYFLDRLAGFMLKQISDLKIYYWIDGQIEDAFCDSLLTQALTIEVGPIAQGVLRYNIFETTKKIIKSIKLFIEKWNLNQIDESKPYDVYTHYKILDFPRDSNNNLTAMIHPQRMDKDFYPLCKGEPLFIDSKGNTYSYEENERVYPIFINEAAYYEKSIAMILTKKETWLL